MKVPPEPFVAPLDENGTVRMTGLVEEGSIRVFTGFVEDSGIIDCEDSTVDVRGLIGIDEDSRGWTAVLDLYEYPRALFDPVPLGFIDVVAPLPAAWIFIGRPLPVICWVVIPPIRLITLCVRIRVGS